MKVSSIAILQKYLNLKKLLIFIKFNQSALKLVCFRNFHIRSPLIINLLKILREKFNFSYAVIKLFNLLEFLKNCSFKKKLRGNEVA